jgi:hypothetical protein
LHEAPLGSVDRRSANREAGCDHVVADTSVGRQQDLRSLDLARRVFAAIKQRRELSVRSMSLRLTRYRMFMLILPEDHDESSR